MSEIKKLRYKLNGVWYDSFPSHKIQDCEAVEITEIITLEEYKKLVPPKQNT